MTAAPLPNWVAEYVGLPWKALGRDRAGLDCYGLVRLVLAEKFAIDMPPLDGGWSGTRDARPLDDLAEVIAGLVRVCCGEFGWREVDFTDAPRLGDVAQFLLYGRPLHVGLVVAANWFLHVREGTNSAVERLDGMAWRGRLVAVYRHASLATAQSAEAANAARRPCGEPSARSARPATEGGET